MTVCAATSGPRLQPLDERVARAGDGDPDQPVAAPGDVVGVAGQVLGDRRSRCRPASPVSQWRTTVRAADSATATKSSAAERDAVGEAEPVEDRRDGAVRVAPQQPAGPGVLDEVVLPVLDAELRRRVGEPDRAVGGDRRVVAEDHPDAVDAVGDRLDRRRERVSTRSRPRCASQTSSRPSRSISRPSGRPPVSATLSTLPPSGRTRQIVPSSVPVKTAPSSGPWVATTTSSAPWPGTGMTVRLVGAVTRQAGVARTSRGTPGPRSRRTPSGPGRGRPPVRRTRSGGPRRRRRRRR